MIKAPYNFVPLNEKVYIPKWADLISQDIPFSDGEDGIIDVTIKNLSPIFTRDGHTRANSTEWSSNVRNGDKKSFFIPATTLKGCFRSVLEILSFSKMSRYNDDFFGYRSFTTQIKGADYNKIMQKIKYCGWLYQENGKYYINECAKGIVKISHKDLKGFFPDFYEGKDHETAETKQMSIGTPEVPYPIIDTTARTVEYVKAGKYKVVCTGFMNGKKVEYLFSTEVSDKLEVTDEVFRKFNTIHKYTTYYAGKKGQDGFLKRRLMSGLEIPVFFEKANNNVINMGITRMFRYPYKFSIKENIKKVQAEDLTGKVDLPEAIFGYTDSEDQLKGRVQFSHAFCTSTIQDGECELKKGVFGRPRASYFPLYLRQNRGEVSNYNENIPIAGRKRYRMVTGHQTVKLSEGNDNDNTKVAFRPLPAKKTFTCSIRVHNLRKAEIGALISAITFHGNSSQGAYHNLGLAKAYGYGCVSCDITDLKGLKYSVTEYLTAFENEIIDYMRETYQDDQFSMQEDEALTMLVKIARDTHSKEQMEHMQLGEFEQYKESRNYATLEESNDVRLLNMAEVKQKREQRRAIALYENIRRNNLIKADNDPQKIKAQIGKLEFVRQTFETNGLDTADIIVRLEELKTLLNVLEKPTQLAVGTSVTASCIANKKVRVENCDYDIQLTAPKGTDTEKFIGKQLEVRIKQISKIGKIVQVEFIKQA